MRAAAQRAWGSPSLEGRAVGVAGVGKVGRHLVGHLVADGAEVVVTDVNAAAVAAVLEEHPGVRAVADTEELVTGRLDVYAPCALGRAVDDHVAEVLAAPDTASVVCGAANNQLAHPGLDKMLADHGVLYAPDYLVNAGGLIQVADELEGFSFERAKARASGIYDATLGGLPDRRRGRRPPGGRRRPEGRAPHRRRGPAARALAGPAVLRTRVAPSRARPRRGRASSARPHQ